MACADGNQYYHPAHEQRYGVTAQYQRESHAEEQREDGVELPVNQHVLQEPYYPVNTCRRHGRLLVC